MKGRVFDKIRSFPESSGIYLMKDVLGNVIYVGKSKNLKKRVKQYFYNSKNHQPKIIDLIKRIDDISYIATDTELEALLLECKLVRKLKPMYNSQLKNYSAYPYLKITLFETFPTLKIVNEKVDDGSIYFGPFPGLNPLEKAVDYLFKRIPLKRCNITSKKNSSVCLNYHLENCPGVCTGQVSQKAYKKNLESLINVLKGQNPEYLSSIKKEMLKASEELNFEKALKLRDELSTIEYLLYNLEVLRNSKEGKNLLIIEKIKSDKYKIFLFKGNILIFKDLFNLTTSINEIRSSILELISKHLKKDFTKNFLHKDELDEIRIVYSYLKNNNKSLFTLEFSDTWLKENNFYKLELEVIKIIKELKRI